MPRTGMTAQELQEKAIDATMARIRQHGFDKVRLVDIAKDLGVSHAALYSHFSDKSALLDAVSERWLTCLDAEQEKICQSGQDPLQRIEAWFLNLHRAKREKVMADPELYKAFNCSAEAMKPFVKEHLDKAFRQLGGLVSEAIANMQLGPLNSETIVDDKALTAEILQVLLDTTTKFHHPKQVLEHLGEDTEKSLKLVLQVVFRGFACP